MLIEYSDHRHHYILKFLDQLLMKCQGQNINKNKDYHYMVDTYLHTQNILQLQMSILIEYKLKPPLEVEGMII